MPHSAAAGMRQMGSRHFGFQEDNVTVSQVWSKLLTCHYDGFITLITVVKCFYIIKRSDL